MSETKTSKTSTTSRLAKARRIAATKGRIRHLRDAEYLVAGDSGCIYLVDLENEKCECMDHEIHHHNCKHLIAVMIFAARASARTSSRSRTLLRREPRSESGSRPAMDERERAEKQKARMERNQEMVRQANVCKAWLDRMEAVS